MKKTIKVAICLALVFVTMLGLCTPASAASARKYSTSGDSYAAKVIQIKTDRATKLRFDQTKGSFNYQNWTLGTVKKNSYGDFYIYVVDQSGKDSPKNYECSLKKSVTISLKANRTYTITVCAQSDSTTFNRLVRNRTLWNKGYNVNSITWTKLPRWTLTVDRAMSFSTIKTIRTPQC